MTQYVDPTTAQYSAAYNPLSVMRTYSYHHILLAVKNTKSAQNLLTNTDLDLYAHPDQKGKGRRFTPQSSSPSSPNDYVVLINGMTDVQFNIGTLNLESFIIPSAGSATYPRASSAATVSGKFTVNEPDGIRFLEVLSQTAIDLGVQVVEVVYMLKTIFVGHGYDGKPVVISNVKPLTFQILDLGCIFTSMGSEYSVTLAPIENGVGNLPVMTSGIGLNAVTTTGTVKQAIQDLFTRIEQTQQDQLKASGNRDPNSIIHYQAVFLDPPKLDTPRYDSNIYILDQIDEAHKTGDKITLTFNVNDTIQQGIESILSRSSKVVDEMRPIMKEDGTYQSAWRPKITSEVQTDVDGSKTIIFHIGKMEFPYLPPADSDCGGISQGDSLRDQAIKKMIEGGKADGSLLELDYIFTGKNTEVLDFEMKVDLAFGSILNQQLQNVPLTQSTVLDGESPVYSVQRNATSNGTCGSVPMPLPMGRVGTGLTAASNNHFREWMRKASQFETTEVKMSIRGNPRLYSGVMSSSYEDINFSGGNGGNGTWMEVPSVIKVNVMMPAVDPTTGMPDMIRNQLALKSYQSLTSTFWYDGLFLIYQVNTIFDAGEFKQDLILMSLPTADNDINSTRHAEGTAGTQQTTTGSGGATQPKVKDSRGTNTIQNQKAVAGAIRGLTTQQRQAQTIADYSQALMVIESSGSLTVINELGYMGLYQMGYYPLVEAGLIQPISNSRMRSRRNYVWNRTTFEWGGKMYTCSSENDFLNTKAVQDYALYKMNQKNWGYLADVHGYVGQRVGGVLITATGLLAGAHLCGPAAVKTFCKSNGTQMAVDGNKVPVVNYITCMGNKTGNWGAPASQMQKTAGAVIGTYDWSISPKIYTP